MRAPTPTDDELFAAYWKDQVRTNFYAHGPAQIAQGLRNVYFLGLNALREPLRLANIDQANAEAERNDLLEALETVHRVLQGDPAFDILTHQGRCLGDVVRDAIAKAKS